MLTREQCAESRRQDDVAALWLRVSHYCELEASGRLFQQLRLLQASLDLQESVQKQGAV